MPEIERLNIPPLAKPSSPIRLGRLASCLPYVGVLHLFPEQLWPKLTGCNNQKLVSGIAYWLEADWRRLLSERAPDVLTLERKDQIVAVFAQFPWWGQQKVYYYLNKQGVKVSHSQVRQAALIRGWNKLRQQLQKRFTISAESI